MATRRRQRTTSALGTGALIMVVAGCGFGSGAVDDAGGGSGPDTSPDAMPPWPAPATDVRDLVEQAGLDLGPMGTAEHYHPTLRVVVDGEDVSVPPNIGVDATTGAMSAVHTHEGDGTIHVEAGTVGDVYTLGQLFTQWNVALGQDRIGGVTSTSPVSVTVDGRAVPGDPADVQLAPEQEIVVEIG